MGARNVAAAYQAWAGKLPPLSMQVLIYMALVSKDSDAWPWYAQGHAALAEHALGRRVVDKAALKAVERAMTPLLAMGAVVTERKASTRRDGASTARYRLTLDAVDAPRIPGADDDLWDGVDETARPPETVLDAPRKPSARPPETVRTPPEFRGTEEEEDQEERENQEQIQALRTAVTVPRARCPTHPAMTGGLRADQLPACPPCRAAARPRKESHVTDVVVIPIDSIRRRHRETGPDRQVAN